MKPTEKPHPFTHSKEEMRTVISFAKRAGRHAARFDDATLQLLREWLWRQLSGGELDVEVVKSIFPLIIAARRIALAESKLAKQENEWTVQEHTDAVREIWNFSPAGSVQPAVTGAHQLTIRFGLSAPVCVLRPKRNPRLRYAPEKTATKTDRRRQVAQ